MRRKTRNISLTLGYSLDKAERHKPLKRKFSKNPWQSAVYALGHKKTAPISSLIAHLPKRNGPANQYHKQMSHQMRPSKAHYEENSPTGQRRR